MTTAFPVSIREQGHLDMFSRRTKKFYYILISCMALHTYVFFNRSHCFIKSWWNRFGPQRPLGFHLWETLEFLRYHQGCSPGNDAHMRPDLWGQAASQESRDPLCSLWEAEGFPIVLERYIWASWSNTQLKLLGKHSFIDKCQGTPKI